MYSKKVSREEARCGFVLILKNKRGLFPASGERFNLIYRESRLPVVVDEISCACVGADRPHKHFHLHVPVQLKAGDEVRICKEDGEYRLEIKRG